MTLENPIYYSGNTLEVDKLNNLLEGTPEAAFMGSLEEAINDTDTRKDFKFLFKSNVATGVITEGVSVLFDSDSDSYTINSALGTAADIVGAAAVAAAITALLPVTGSIIAAAAIGATSQFLWNAIKEVDIVEDVFDVIEDTVDTHIEIVDENDNPISGVLYEDGVEEEEELTAINDLLFQADFVDAVDIVPGNHSIKVFDNANTDFFDEARNTYSIYDGSVVKVIAEEFNIAPDRLLQSDFGTENEPNRNIDIFYSRGVSDSFFPDDNVYLFANSENRFFVPLPIAGSEEANVTGFHPGNILYGTESNDDIDYFDNTLRLKIPP